MLTETVTLQTLLGHATLERERVATVELPAEAAGAATRLRLPFSSLTPSIKYASSVVLACRRGPPKAGASLAAAAASRRRSFPTADPRACRLPSQG